MLFFLSTLSFSLSVASASHTIRFFNYCGSGTPSIVTHNSKTSLNSTGTYYSDNANDGTIHTFLDQGSCGDDEEKCTTVNVDLTIPEASISQTNNYSVPLSLQYSCANNSTYFAQCYTANCDPTPISCSSFNSQLIITFCPLGSSSLTSPTPTPSSPTLKLKLIASIIAVLAILITALTITILFLRRKPRNRCRSQDPSPETTQAQETPQRPERTSTLTVPSYQSTRVGSTISKTSWQDFRSASHFIKLHPTESEISAFED